MPGLAQHKLQPNPLPLLPAPLAAAPSDVGNNDLTPIYPANYDVPNIVAGAATCAVVSAVVCRADCCAAQLPAVAAGDNAVRPAGPPCVLLPCPALPSQAHASPPPLSPALPHPAVAATRPANDLAAFSNFGASTVHLAAPGVSIRTTAAGGDDAYDWMSGTSQAAPQVAGAAALMFALRPGATAAQVK